MVILKEGRILSILEKYKFKGIRKSVGKNIICFCPFHDNKHTPSFSLNLKTGLWCCFSGECDLKGNFVKLIMKLERCNYEDALKIIYSGSENLVYESMLDNLNFDKEMKEKKDIPYIDLKPCMLESIPKWEYYLNKINIKPEIAKKAGIEVSKNKYYYNKLIIPVFESNDKKNILDVELRKWLPQDLEKKVLYLPGSEMKKWVYGFGLYPKAPKTAILVEGVKDVLTIMGFGFFALGIFGTKMSKEKINMLLKNGIQRVIISLDSDDAGNEASKKIEKEMSNYFEVFKINLPQGKDPNDLNYEEFLNLINKNPIIKETLI